MATNRIYCAIGLTGGDAGDLDTIDGQNLAQNDMAIVIDSDTNVVYFYNMNLSGGASESSPNVIIPDENNDSGNKNWEIQSIYTTTLELTSALTTDLTTSGKKSTETVDANSTGIGAALYMKADGDFAEADADSATTMPCVALATETGVGSKTILLEGFIRNNTWAWGNIGQPVFVSGTTGGLTQTAPAGSGDVVQVVGIAWTADSIYFKPEFTLIVIT